MLVLFDIDGTLLMTGEASLLAIQDSAREIFGRDLVHAARKKMAGRLDPAIWRDLCEANGIEDADRYLPRFRQVFALALDRRLAEMGSAYSLPGVPAVLERLSSEEAVTLGLLTGNFPETGSLKIRHAGLDPDLFQVAAWGDDAETRRGLPAVAIARYSERSGTEPPRERVVLVGDTERDVDAAHHAGIRCLAVATGWATADALRDAGADCVVPDLTSTDDVAAWILDGG